MNLHLSRWTLTLGATLMNLLLTQDLHAAEPPPGLVRVEYYQDVLADYRDRRSDHGFMFGLDYTEIMFDKYLSTLDSQNYKALFGETTIPFIGLSFDYKYNFSLGSLLPGLSLTKGSISSHGSGDKRTMDVLKYGLGLKFVADNIFKEPYVAPYIGADAWMMDISESSSTDKFSATTDIGYSYTVGMLIQLDWLDPDTDTGSTFNWGLENTFLDLYVTQLLKTINEGDPNISTDFTFGGGLRFEF